MTRTSPDRRIKRTQQSLHVALNHLILEKAYEAITVKDVTDRANVGRSTFYAHHGSKEGLLLSGLQHLHAALAGAGGAAAPMFGFSRVFFEHAQEYRNLFQALLKSESGPIVTRKIKHLLADAVRRDLSRITGEAPASDVPREAMVQFTVDALFSILLWWFERSPKLSPGEVDAIFRRLTLPGVVRRMGESKFRTP